MNSNISLLEQSFEYNKPFILCTVIEACGSTPQKAGARMCVFVNGKIIGTIGGGCVEGDIIRTAISMLVKNKYEPVIKKVLLNDDIGKYNADVCGGTLKVLLERVV